MSIQESFKKKFTFEKRKSEANKMINKYPDHIPIVVESKGLIKSIDKSKFIVNNDLTVGQFIHVIRKRIKLEPTESIYVLVGNAIPMQSTTLSEVYKEHKDKDNFLYMTYCKENTFG